MTFTAKEVLVGATILGMTLVIIIQSLVIVMTKRFEAAIDAQCVTEAEADRVMRMNERIVTINELCVSVHSNRQSLFADGGP